MTGFHRAYFETCFVGEPIPSDFPASFAIISACSPTGERWPEDRNQVADQLLKMRVRRWRSHRITGRSPDGHHVEPGWAVPCSKLTAISIAREFQQDAFYWVEADFFEIVDSSQGRASCTVGSFKEKFATQIGYSVAPIWRPLVVGESECSQFLRATGLDFALSELLFIGQGADSPYHQWKLGYWILSDAKSGVRVLNEVEFPCGTVGDDDSEPTLGSRIVAILVDSTARQEVAAKRLFEGWSAHKEARHIDEIFDISKLGEAAQIQRPSS
jgi:hypothetical protein